MEDWRIRLSNPRNPYDIDLKAMRECLFHILDLVEKKENSVKVKRAKKA